MIDLDPYNPYVVDHKVIQINLYQMNVKRTRCILEAKEIESGWNSLKYEGFPLEDISSTLVALEGIQYLKTREFNVLPYPMHILRLVDAINACKSIDGFEQRKNDLKDRLSTIIKNNRHIRIGSYQDYCDQLLKALLSTTDEFRIAYALKQLEPSLEFTTVKGKKYPDFRIQNYETIFTQQFSLAEVKSRLNRSYAEEEEVEEDSVIVGG
jgi:hypothetical protein